MRRICLLALIISVSSAAAAQEIGPDDVIISAVRDEIAACVRERFSTGSSATLACFDRPGVTTDAQNLSRTLFNSTGYIGILAGLSDAGQVDVAEIFFPMLANTNHQLALVNTSDGVQLATDLNFTRNPPSVPSTRAILSRYPQAFESGRVSVVAVRHLPGGNQRFVLADIVTNKCRACAPVAKSLRYFDFSEGRFSGFKEVGWQPWQDITMSRAADRIRNGDVVTIQDRLNHMGYDAGPTDGAAGPRTMAAVMSFKRDYCLPEDNRISESFISYLTPKGTNFAVPPCALGNSAGPAPSLPFPEGVYSADARLCPPAPLSVRAELGDRAYGMVIDVANGNWNWGESLCTIRQASDTGAGFALDLDCLAEGTSQQSQVMLAATHSEGFSYRGRDFWQCQKPATMLPISAGVYAHDGRLCPGSLEQAPNEVVFEGGARPLFINGSEFSWDHVACQITTARRAGPDWGIDLSCVSGTDKFETTQSITILSDNKVLFDGLERTWCGPPIAPVSQKINKAGDLPMPLVEGVYSFDVAGCPEYDGTTRTEREQIAANLRVTLGNGDFNQGNQTCPIASFTRAGDQAHLEMDCLYDGISTFYRFEMEPLGQNSFQRYDDTYNLCAAPNARDELNHTLNRVAYSAKDIRYWALYDDIRGDQMRDYMVGRALTLSRTGQVTGIGFLLNDPRGKPSPAMVLERSKEYLSRFLRLSEVLSVFDTGEGAWRNEELGDLYTLYIMNRARSRNQHAFFDYKNLKPSGFLLEPRERSAFHAIDLNPLNVEKWTHHDGREYVYERMDDGTMRPVFDGTNNGTYNYCLSGVCHTILDILPWVLWGATADDKTTPEKRAEMLLNNGRFLPGFNQR